jgi:peptide-methionine (S)-S-oxide reductase
MVPSLPVRPSREYLHKHAKRLARDGGIPLPDARRALAAGYGFRTWDELIAHAARLKDADHERGAQLFAAARAGDAGAVRQLLATGVNPRTSDGKETALHLAARNGPLRVVEALISGGALEWQPDRAGRTPVDAARRGRTRERAAIIELLERRTISDDGFRAAVAAIHTGALEELEQLLDAEPRLLRERIVEPEVFQDAPRPNYFLNPKLFWFIAWNPTPAEPMPENIAVIVRAMIERRVDLDDLEYALGLVMSSAVAREAGHQRELIGIIMDAGAQVTRDAILATAGYWEHDALRAVLERGVALSAPIAAALGLDEELSALLTAADERDVQTAFGLAVINRHETCASRALAAGADVNARLPLHAHSTALHQAAADNSPSMIALLLKAGADPTIHDTLWNGTPLGWAEHGRHEAAIAALRPVTPI